MAKNKNEASLDAKLIAVYNKYGINTFLDVCSEMLNIKDKADWEKKKKSNGEVCEVVLDVLTKHYLKTRGIVGETFHSMILADRKNLQSNFRTELDFTLLTPFFCVTGECKSFVGSIEVVEECTLVRGDMRADVAKQSWLHSKCLKQYLEDFALPNINCLAPPYGMFCFLYSNSEIRDTRVTAAKQTIPITTIKSLYSYYDQLVAGYTKKVYDYERACKTFRQMSNSQRLHDQHRKFLGY